MDLMEVKTVCRQLIADGQVDFLDISLWDCFKLPKEEKYQDKPLLAHFTELDWQEVKLTVAGKIKAGSDVHKVLASGVDFVTIGRSAILHHDFPVQVLRNPDFTPTDLPVSPEYLEKEGLGPAFIQYMRRWPDFVS
jgi:2,4-dienoyl-CoA reductase-like NADH-dependent reductase (Old Yellow Enzyme family)